MENQCYTPMAKRAKQWENELRESLIESATKSKKFKIAATERKPKMEQKCQSRLVRLSRSTSKNEPKRLAPGRRSHSERKSFIMSRETGKTSETLEEIRNILLKFKSPKKRRQEHLKPLKHLILEVPDETVVNNSMVSN